MNDENFVMVEINSLPTVFKKVLQVKKLLDTGVEKNVQEAANKVQLSRSAYYKYKDKIFAIATTKGRTVTVAINLEDVPGTLANILKIIADQGHNIFTINQTIPINGIANLTVTIGTDSNDISLLQKAALDISGVKSFKILAME